MSGQGRAGYGFFDSLSRANDRPAAKLTAPGQGTAKGMRAEVGAAFKNRYASGKDFDRGNLDRRSAVRSAITGVRGAELGSGHSKTARAKAKFDQSTKAAAMGGYKIRRHPAGSSRGGQFKGK